MHEFARDRDAHRSQCMVRDDQGPQSMRGDDLLSRRVRLIKLAPTIAMAERAKELRAEGKDVISLAVGEPDFETPEQVIEAAYTAAKSGFTRYTAADGAAFVKDAVREKLLRDNAESYEREEIHIASGCKQVISNAFAATLDPGDEVVIFAPGWVSYAEMVEFSGGTPVLVQTRLTNGFLPDPDDLRQALGPRTKWVLINSPNNPTGAVYPSGLLAEIARIVGEHPRAMLMSDEIYEHLVFDRQTHVSLIGAAPELRERMLIVNGVSKSYAMTGWRIGFAAGPRWLISAMAKVQSQTAGSSNSIGQAAAAAALTGDQHLLTVWRGTLESRRDRALHILATTDRVFAARPAGTFYIFVDVSCCIGACATDGRTIRDDSDFAEYLLDTAHVATVPGTAFGASPYIRLSFALDEERLSEAFRRIVAACNALSGPDDPRGAATTTATKEEP